MKNSTYKKDRPQLSESQILKNKSFENTLKSVNSSPYTFLKSIKFWGTGGVATIIIVTSIFLLNKETNTQEENLNKNFTYRPSDNVAQITSIKPPFLEHDIPYEVFNIDCNKDEEITTKSGTIFRVSKNSLIDAKGNIMAGTAEIHYREFRNPIDFFLSGIPMDYDSAGVNYVFESAGMLDIKAFQNDIALELANNKLIDFEFNSTTNEGGYNFYSLNKESGVWTNEQQQIDPIQKMHKSNDVNKIKKVSKMSVVKELEKPITPIKQNKKKYSLNLTINKENYPELEKYEGTIFEINEVENKFDPIIYKIQWEDASLSDSEIKGNYTLKLTREDSSIYLTVYPVVKNDAYEKAIVQYNKEMDKYKELSNESKDNFDAYDNNSYTTTSPSQEINTAITREFTIAGFGIYNCDTPQMRPDALASKNTINLDGETIKLPFYYIANTNKNSVVSMYNRKSKKVKYYKKGLSVIWTVNDDETLSIIHPHQFESIEDLEHLTLEPYSTKEGIELLRELMAYK